MKTFVLSTEYYKKLIAYRDRISPDLPLPVLVYNITDKKIKLNLKFNSNYGYSYESSQNKEKWIATLCYDEENENSLTLLLLHTI